MKLNLNRYLDEEGNLDLDLLQELEELSADEIDLIALKQWEIKSKDAKDFGPSWLEGVQGSLAEERRQNQIQKVKAYNDLIAKARKFDYAQGQLFADKFFTNPGLLDIKLSELWVRYPSLTISYNFNIQQLTRSSTRLLRGFVIWFYQQENLSEYIKYEIESQLDTLLLTDNKYPKNQKVLKEILIIRKLFLFLEKDLAIHILYSLYKEDNLKRWYQTTELLVKKYKVVKIQYVEVKEKVRRRGHRSSHSNKRITKDQRGEVKMSKEARELEEIKLRIRKKQAILFERRLDAFLAMEDSNLPLAARKEIFNALLDPVEEQTADSISLPDTEEI
jgi:hypothetical protein